MSGSAKARRTPGAKVPGGDAGWHKRIRLARENAGLSVDQAAVALGVSVSALRKWEGGHLFPSRENLLETAELYAVDMVWLLTGFSAEELRIAEKIVGMRPLPVLSLGQVRLIEPGSLLPEWPEDTPAVIPSFPCSPQSFATEIFDHRNAPDFEVGDIVIIDPTVEPVHDDMVLAAVGPVRNHIFARYVLRGLDPHVDQQVEQHITQIKERLRKATEVLVDVVGKEEVIRELLEMAKEFEEQRRTGPPDAWLAPARGDPIPIRHSERCILGVMVEHRHPRRALIHRPLRQTTN